MADIGKETATSHGADQKRKSDTPGAEEERKSDTLDTDAEAMTDDYAKKVRRMYWKIDLHIIGWTWILYICSVVDR